MIKIGPFLLGIFALMVLFIPDTMAQNNEFHQDFGRIANVRYSISTFKGNVNWAKKPRLVQMTPAVNSSCYRRPATVQEKTKRTVPVVNIVILVHGHNEKEKVGFGEKETPDVWEYAYKREVWDKLYKYYLERNQKSELADKTKVDDCTIFYEFIYPTYRPIFTPVPDGANKITPLSTLGQDLGEAINQELLTGNTQVAQMIKNDIPFNIFLVAHSMGGLVSRAGLRFLDDRLLKNFRQLITWGTPHQGSPLNTLRYIMAAGFDVCIDGYAYRPDKLGNATGWLADWAVMDAPGSRDLRWTNGSAGIEKFFKYDRFFRENSVEQFEGREWDLRSGSMFYNDNLKVFNETERFSDRYTFLTGNTSKIAGVEKGNYTLSKAFYLVKAKYTDGETAIGAYFIKLLAEDEKMKANDGASPVYSQGGYGLFPRPKAVDMGDINHEEFYGTQGMAVAEKTFGIMNENAICNCPYFDGFTQNADTVIAKLIWPGVSDPSRLFSNVELRLMEKATNKLVSSSVNCKFIDSKGTIRGTISAGNVNPKTNIIIDLRASGKYGMNVRHVADYVPVHKTDKNSKESDLSNLNRMTMGSVTVNDIKIMHSYKDIGNPNPELSRNFENFSGEPVRASFGSSDAPGKPPVSWSAYTFSWEFPGNADQYLDKESIQITVKPGSPATVSGIITKSKVGCENCTKIEKLIFRDIPFKERIKEPNFQAIVFELVMNGPAQKYIPEYSIIETADFGNGHHSVETIKMLGSSKVNIQISFVGEVKDDGK
jgi:hypothetical protein